MAESNEDMPLGFKPGTRLLEKKEAKALVPVEAYIVSPVMTVEEAAKGWDIYLRLKGMLLNDPNCYDVIEGSKEMNRTGATRLATAFGLSLDMTNMYEATIDKDRRFIVRVRASRGARYADGVGSCRVSEITMKTASDGKREHFALGTAYTRAAKRAIADILGGTEAE